jgi:serine/threonine protein kinase
VAIKFLRSWTLLTDPGVVDQFRAEARLLARLNHPNVVRVWDFEDDPQRPWLVLEYVEGLTAADLISRSGQLQPWLARRITLQVARGLQAAASLGIIHRDVKPANILLTHNEEMAKLADLGLALVVAGAPAEAAASGPGFTGVAGTAAYMAPEQAEGAVNHVDHRADIYALGATLYHMLTGRPAFQGRTCHELILKHAVEPPRPPSELAPAISADLDDIVLRMLAKKPTDRYPDYEALIGDLEQLG